MGRIRKSTSLGWDMSATQSAPVSGPGEMRVRPKADGTTLQLSYNGGAWFDSGGGSGTVRLDQVLDPNIPATEPPTNRVKTFTMTDHSLVFGFSAAESEDCFVVQSAPDAPGAGSLLLLQTLGTATNKQPLRVEGRGAFLFGVGVDGKVAIGAETGLVHKLNVYHTNTGGTNTGVIHGSVALGAGNTAATMTGAELRVTDAGNTTALLSLKNVDCSLDRESTAVANTSLVCTNVDVNSNINANTLTLRSLNLNMQVHGSTLTNWEALRIRAPGTLLGGAVTNKRAIITEAGAGNVGFGTLTPAAQLHVSGTARLDLGSDARGDIPFRGSDSNLTRLGMGTPGQVLTVTDIGGGVLEPRYATPAGGGGALPAGSATELQFRSSASAFGAVPSSSVSGSTIELGGNLTLTSRFAVDATGIKFIGVSTQNGMFYQDSFGYILGIGYPSSQARVLKSSSNASLPPSWGQISLSTNFTAPNDILTGTLGAANGGTGLTSPGPSGNVLTSNGTAWVSSAPAAGGGSPGGSGTELQYRGGASTFSAVSGSSVDGSGNVVLGGGALTLQSSAAGSFFYMKAALATSGPTIYTERSRGTLTSKSGLLAGDALFSIANHGYDSGLGLRQGVAIDFSAQANFSSTSAPTVYRLRTTHVNSVTPQGRMIIGASRTLTDNTLTDLFTITFGTTDHVALGGEIHLIFVAKQVSGTVATHVYRRKISFIIGHNGATNTGMCNFREDSGSQASAGSSGGFTAIDHAINSDAAVGIATPITQNVGSWNALTYKMLANSDLTTFSQFTCYYNIFYHGEGELALPASA